VLSMKGSPIAGQKLSFQANLENWAAGMDYCAVHVPAEISEALGTKGPVLVMARVNESEAFQVSLFPVGSGKHCIRIKAKVRQETKTKTGDSVRVRFTVLDRAEAILPEDLVSALRAEGVAEDFASLPPGKQSFTIRRIDEAARPETRAKRIQEAVEAAIERREHLVGSARDRDALATSESQRPSRRQENRRVKKPSQKPESDLPKGMGAPATRALNGAGFATLKQLTRATHQELLELHGFGPKAMKLVLAALDERGLSLAEPPGDPNAKKPRS
jgi:predicted flap endonuclease-1-like 5' DNA nuclease